MVTNHELPYQKTLLYNWIVIVLLYDKLYHKEKVKAIVKLTHEQVRTVGKKASIVLDHCSFTAQELLISTIICPTRPCQSFYTFCSRGYCIYWVWRLIQSFWYHSVQSENQIVLVIKSSQCRTRASLYPYAIPHIHLKVKYQCYSRWGDQFCDLQVYIYWHD